MRFVDEASDDAQAFIDDQEQSFPVRIAELGIDEAEAWRGYHLLQVWDRLSLYACLADLEAGKTETIPAVPLDGAEVELAALPARAGRVSRRPRGRSRHRRSSSRSSAGRCRRRRGTSDADFRAAFFAAPVEQASIALESGSS